MKLYLVSYNKKIGLTDYNCVEPDKINSIYINNISVFFWVQHAFTNKSATPVLVTDTNLNASLNAQTPLKSLSHLMQAENKVFQHDGTKSHKTGETCVFWQ